MLQQSIIVIICSLLVIVTSLLMAKCSPWILSFSGLQEYPLQLPKGREGTVTPDTALSPPTGNNHTEPLSLTNRKYAFWSTDHTLWLLLSLIPCYSLVSVCYPQAIFRGGNEGLPDDQPCRPQHSWQQWPGLTRFQLFQWVLLQVTVPRKVPMVLQTPCQIMMQVTGAARSHQHLLLCCLL